MILRRHTTIIGLLMSMYDRSIWILLSLIDFSILDNKSSIGALVCYSHINWFKEDVVVVAGQKKLYKGKTDPVKCSMLTSPKQILAEGVPQMSVQILF